MPHSTWATQFRLPYFTFHLMNSYFCKIFLYLAALHSSHHLKTFLMWRCAQVTARTTQKMYNFIRLNILSVFKNNDFFFFYRYTQARVCLFTNQVNLKRGVIDYSRPSLVAGVRLGCRAHHESSGVTLCPISGRVPAYVTQKYQLRSVGTYTEVILKNHHFSRYQISVMETQKRRAKSRRGELVLLVERQHNIMMLAKVTHL